jgi:hypothetical protein
VALLAERAGAKAAAEPKRARREAAIFIIIFIVCLVVG